MPEEPFVQAVPLGALCSIAMVVLSKKEKMVEKAGKARTCWELTEKLACTEVLSSLNSMAYRKVGTMGTESQ